jgi:outer membrane protein assembly factor BamB
MTAQTVLRRIAECTLTVLVIGGSHAGVISAQTPPRAAAETTGPAAWLQLRGGTDNAGNVLGGLDVEWRFKAPNTVRGLSIVRGIVVIGTESADAAAIQRGPDQRGSLVGLDVRTGAKLWARDVPTWVHGDPVIYRDRAIVTFGQYPMHSSGGAIAVDLTNGRTLWSFDVDGGVMPAAAIDTVASSVIVAGGDGIIHVLDFETGAEKTAAGLRAGVAMASPRIDDSGHVFVGAEDKLFSYSMRTEKFDWTFSAEGLVELGTPPVALTDSIVFTEGTKARDVLSAFRDLPFGEFFAIARAGYKLSNQRLSTIDQWYKEQWLLAVDRHTGRLRWQQPLGVGLIVLRNNSGIPVIGGNRVLISSPVSQELFAFDLKTGRRLWQRHLEDRHVGALTIVGTDVVFGDRGGYLNFVSVEDGSVIGRCSTGSRFTATAPVVVGKTLFAATRDQWVFAAPYSSLRQRATAPDRPACFPDSAPLHASRDTRR